MTAVWEHSGRPWGKWSYSKKRNICNFSQVYNLQLDWNFTTCRKPAICKHKLGSPSWRNYLVRNKFYFITDFTCICIVFWTLIWKWNIFMIYVQSLKYLLSCLFIIIWFNMFKHNSSAIVSVELKCVPCVISTTGYFTAIKKFLLPVLSVNISQKRGQLEFISGSRVL